MNNFWAFGLFFKTSLEFFPLFLLRYLNFFHFIFRSLNCLKFIFLCSKRIFQSSSATVILLFKNPQISGLQQKAIIYISYIVGFIIVWLILARLSWVWFQTVSSGQACLTHVPLFWDQQAIQGNDKSEKASPTSLEHFQSLIT